MNSFVNTRFFKIGSVVYNHDPEGLAFSNVATFDATVYANNAPRYSMIRESTSIRPHLVRNINLLDEQQRLWLQDFWNRADQYVNAIATPRQCFLVISTNGHSVLPHTHGDHLGDTITVVTVQGTKPVSTKLVIEDHTKLLYPPADNNFYAVCFDSDAVHSTESHDDNVYFHFVYDLEDRVNIPKNIWVRI